MSTSAYIETVGAAGHMLPYEQPELAARAIVTFLA